MSGAPAGVWPTLARRAAAVAVGLAADAAFGEPARWHPVAGFGTVMRSLEGHWWDDRRWRGAAYAATGLLGVAAVGEGATLVVG
ncbi:MAG: hypothetical protein ACRDYZ_13555, partial [Acidimicrobiales bacterium]